MIYFSSDLNKVRKRKKILVKKVTASSFMSLLTTWDQLTAMFGILLQELNKIDYIRMMLVRVRLILIFVSILHLMESQ